MLTAAITAAVAAVLALFGIEPGAYLVWVAAGVKLSIVALSVAFGGRSLKRWAAARTPAARAEGAPTTPGQDAARKD